jgi:hypothetical protein
MSRPRLYIRRFLNKPGFHAGAYILISVSSVDSLEGGCVGVTFTLTDCYDDVSLDFDMDTPANRANSLHKARLLREALAELTETLEAATAEIDARRPTRKQRQAS